MLLLFQQLLHFLLVSILNVINHYDQSSITANQCSFPLLEGILSHVSHVSVSVSGW